MTYAKIYSKTSEIINTVFKNSLTKSQVVFYFYFINENSHRFCILDFLLKKGQ